MICCACNSIMQSLPFCLPGWPHWAGASQEYRAIIATSLDGFFVCDRDGRFLDVNQAYRRLLDDRLGQVRAAALRSGCYGALLLLDLDNFKPLNDAYGHAAGDLLLIEVARRLTLTLRAADNAARRGGDEFVLLIGDLSAEEADAARHVGRLPRP